MTTNCKNCGAPLHGNRCEYCGTEYSVSQDVYVELDGARIAEAVEQFRVVAGGGGGCSGGTGGSGHFDLLRPPHLDEIYKWR